VWKIDKVITLDKTIRKGCSESFCNSGSSKIEIFLSNKGRLSRFAINQEVVESNSEHCLVYEIEGDSLKVHVDKGVVLVDKVVFFSSIRKAKSVVTTLEESDVVIGIIV